MSNGNFCWYELMTTDPVAAAAFYTNVVGWRAEESGLPGMDYTIVRMDETGIGGIMAVPDEAAKAGARPCWLGYISVDDVDAMAARITAAGGSVKRAAADIPQVGRFAVVADPQGAVFIVFKSNATTEPAPVAPGTPGHGGWHELHADDWEKVFPFYGELFGWAKSNAMDMGPMGVYQLFAKDGADIGGMLTRHKAGPPMPVWSYYFNVPDINAAVQRVTASGGQVLMGPQEVPGGSRIIQGMDPQGAMFALVAPPPG